MIHGYITKIHEYTEDENPVLELTIRVNFPIIQHPLNKETKEQYIERIKNKIDDRFMYENLHLGNIQLEQDVNKHIIHEDIADEYYDPNSGKRYGEV